MPGPLPTVIRPNFSGSSELFANLGNTTAKSGALFGNINKALNDRTNNQRLFDLQNEKFEWDKSAGDRNAEAEQAKFDLELKRNQETEAQLQGIFGEQGGSLFDQRKMNTDLDTILAGNSVYQSQNSMQKAATKDRLFAELGKNKAQTSDPELVRKNLMQQYGATGKFKDIDALTKRVDSDMANMFGQLAPKDVVTSLFSGAGKSSGSSFQEKLMLKMVGNQGKRLNESNPRENAKALQEFYTDYNLERKRASIAGITLPDIGEQKVYQKHVKGILGEGASLGLPQSSILAALGTLITDEHTESGMNLGSLTIGQKEALYSKAQQFADIEGGGNMNSIFAGLQPGSASAPGLSTGDLLGALTHQAKTRGQVDSFLQNQFKNMYGSGTIMPAAAGGGVTPTSTVVAPPGNTGNPAVVPPTAAPIQAAPAPAPVQTLDMVNPGIPPGGIMPQPDVARKPGSSIYETELKPFLSNMFKNTGVKGDIRDLERQLRLTKVPAVRARIENELKKLKLLLKE